MMNSYTWPRVNSVTEERDSTLTFYRPSSEPRLDSRRIFACWESADTEGRHVRHIGGKIVSRIALRCIRLLSFPWQPHCAGSKHAGPVLKRVRLPEGISFTRCLLCLDYLRVKSEFCYSRRETIGIGSNIQFCANYFTFYLGQSNIYVCNNFFNFCSSFRILF